MSKRKQKNTGKEEGHEEPKLKYKMDDEGRRKEPMLEMTDAEEMKLDLLDMEVSYLIAL